MRALPEVEQVTFDVERETFQLRAAGPALPKILTTISELGFEAAVIDERGSVRAATPTRILSPEAPALRAALARAAARSVPLFVYCHGAFCPTCKQFEQTVLATPAVQTALRDVEFLKADVVALEDLATDLGVRAVPDLWFLAGDGTVLGRENRALDVEALLAAIRKHTTR